MLSGLKSASENGKEQQEKMEMIERIQVVLAPQESPPMLCYAMLYYAYPPPSAYASIQAYKQGEMSSACMFLELEVCPYLPPSRYSSIVVLH